MATESSFDDIMARLKAGDDEAATEVFQRYVRRLCALARSRLDTRIRQKEDPEDVVQSVMRSFMCRHAEGQFDIENWESLWALLALITLRKCGNRIEYYRADRRNVGRDAGRYAPPADSDESHAAWEAIARDPTPSQAAMLNETLEQLMSELDAPEQTILSLKLQGCTAEEIGSQVGRSERTIGRTVERIKRKLNRILGDSDEGQVVS